MDTLEGVACIAAAIGVTTALMLGKGPFDGSIAAAIVIAVIDVVPMAVGGTMVLASIAGEAMAKGDGRRTTGDTPHDDGTAAHGAMAADAE